MLNTEIKIYKLMIKIFLAFALLLVFLSCHEISDNKIVTNIKQESCLECHFDLVGFSDLHNPQAIGCSSCHLGNINSGEKETAHEGIIKIPGNLSNASKTCSTTDCHHSELSRINNSLMSTNSGIVSIDKYIFDEVIHTDIVFHIDSIHSTAAAKHLKNLCFKCHLGYEKGHYGATTEMSRGGGCLACHLNYKKGKQPNINDKYHPAINLNIDNNKCFGCHSRSSRISTNYEGWYETIHENEEIIDSSKYRVLMDGRIFALAEEDVHHKAGLLCIDCHSSIDVMGDGRVHKHQEQAVKIQCIDCHITEEYNKVDKKNIGNIAALDYVLRKYKYPTTKFIATEKDNIALVNTGFEKEEKAFLISKLNQKLFYLNSAKERCQKDKVHQSLDCGMCHTSWVTSCIGCHMEYDNEVKIKGKKERGKWYEEIGEFNKTLPVMGEYFKNGNKTIKPAIPGMIMTLDKSDFKGNKLGHDYTFLRLFAPISAHTTTSEPRSCESCHNNSEALGYGKGKLRFDMRSKIWTFESLYALSSQDKLPLDAWIGFSKSNEDTIKYSAHQGFYPLSLEDRKKILKVGSCLICHPDNKIFRKKMISGEYSILASKCIYLNKI